ncbi:sulfite exporter TauE/SafE family protein [Vibrio sp. YMD68]|uniref:sulfite exporter TauE/SafE family protein n=1 Tax=Vibrio sp. YMD68 TaxID=3042300 RepID=UPI002499B00A|nr:sulfite exporter TauE/SafE family protein [Vibrio sp. YMD68]WGV99012.1 sulfite exporter TauE/SafE family protein [Vibrio sp. YMD68]
MPIDWVGAFFIGLVGAGHCMGMCGGLASALSIGQQNPSAAIPLYYNIGRLLSYSVIGALIGSAVSSLVEFSQLNQALAWLRLVAALFMIILALYVGRWWFGLLAFEKLGQHFWKYISPLGQSLLPLKKPLHALPFGFVWGWLPCGLVYSMLTWAAVSGSAMNGALIMLCFGLGTLPAMLLIGYSASHLKRIQQSTLFRSVGAALILGYGVYTGYGALMILSFSF